MFRYREEGEYGRGYDTQPDYQVKNLSFNVANLGRMVKSSKRSYQWAFEVRSGVDGSAWEFVNVILTDSSFSKKRSLIVNSKKIMDNELM